MCWFVLIANFCLLMCSTTGLPFDIGRLFREENGRLHDSVARLVHHDKTIADGFFSNEIETHDASEGRGYYSGGADIPIIGTSKALVHSKRELLSGADNSTETNNTAAMAFVNQSLTVQEPVVERPNCTMVTNVTATTATPSTTTTSNSSTVVDVLNLNDTKTDDGPDSNGTTEEFAKIVEGPSDEQNNATSELGQDDSSGANVTNSVELVDVGGVESFGSEEKGAQNDDEEDENMVTSLLSAFLGGLSRPDGTVDVEAITGLLGSLSTQRDDGNYEFQGLTELLMGFLGGGEEGDGGSDFGAFIGGLLGAFLKGVARPTGSRGTGNFLGNFVANILPPLSAGVPDDNGDSRKDSGSFFTGLISSLFGGLSKPQAMKNRSDTQFQTGSNFQFLKGIFSMITSIISASSVQ